MRLTALAVLALAGLPLPALGQDAFRTVGTDLRDAGHDALRIWTAPLHTRWRDVPVIGTSAGAALLVYAADRPLEDWVRHHQRSALVGAATPFRDGQPLAGLGKAVPLTLISAGLYSLGLATGKRSLRDAGLGCAGAVLAGSLVRHLVYATVSRARPSVTQTPSDWALRHGDWNHRSFFGGHTANMMTCTTFLASRFQLGPLEPLLYAVGLDVGLARTVDGDHWPSDNFVAAVVGYATGRLEARRSAARAAAGSPRAASPSATALAALAGGREGVSILPGAGGALLAVSIRF